MSTIKKIAERAGVSTATVSLALRGSGEISTARRQEIQNLAEKMGYRKNAYVSTLMRQIRIGGKLPSEMEIAIIYSSPTRDVIEKSYLLSLRLTGMTRRLKERGYHPVVFWYDDPDCSPDRLIQILKARNIRGVIPLAFGQSDIMVRLNWSEFACATQNDYLVGPPIHRVVEDYVANVSMALTELWMRGYWRMGLAYHTSHAPSARFPIFAAYQGFMETVRGDLPPPPPPLVTNVWTKEAFLEWLQKHEIDSVLTFHRQDINQWSKAVGKRIPRDLGLANINATSQFADTSGVDPLPEYIGATTVDLVVEQIESNNYGLPSHQQIITVAGRWQEGTNLRPRCPKHVKAFKERYSLFFRK